MVARISQESKKGSTNSSEAETAAVSHQVVIGSQKQEHGKMQGLLDRPQVLMSTQQTAHHRRRRHVPRREGHNVMKDSA